MKKVYGIGGISLRALEFLLHELISTREKGAEGWHKQTMADNSSSL